MIKTFESQLRTATLENPMRELKQYLAHLRKVSYTSVVFDDVTLSKAECDAMNDFVQRRIKGEPFSKITNEREFYGLNFKVTHDTLDPRPDSETLIDTVKQYFSTEAALRFLDLGTGTGCLSITLLKEFSKCSGVAVDLSEQALIIARENASTHNVLSQLELIHSSWFDNVPKETFDFIISNPPYIAPSESLDKSVLNYDPHLALFGGDDGLDCYRDILKSAKDYLKPSGHIFFEIGYQQGKSVPNLAQDLGYTLHQVIKDYGGNDRVVVLKN